MSKSLLKDHKHYSLSLRLVRSLSERFPTSGNDRRKINSYVFAVLSATIILSFILSQYHPASAFDLDEATSRIQKAYEAITDMRGSFIQKNVIKSLDKTVSYSGEFFIKKPMNMKWAYKGKASQDLLIKNGIALIYKKGDTQAYRSKFSRENFGQSPVVLLTGMGNIKDEFIITGGDNKLILKPKKPMAGVQSITLSISDADFPIRSFKILDGKSNVIEIELKDVIINSGIKDSVFEIKLPKGVSVFDQPA